MQEQDTEKRKQTKKNKQTNKSGANCISCGFQNQVFKYANISVRISSLYKVQGSKAGKI